MLRRGPILPVRPGGATPSPLASAALPALAGAMLLAAGATAAWLLFATPVLHRLADPLARGSTQPVALMLALTIGLAPAAGLLVAGVSNLGRALDRAWPRGIAARLVSRMAYLLPPECAVYPRVWLPDGRSLAEVVVGPFGVVVFGPLPPNDEVRHLGSSWEERRSDGSWGPAENPAVRASRDAERLRHLLVGEERDYVVRVSAALVGVDPQYDSSSGIPLVRPADVPGWLAALRPQRTLDPNRLVRLQAWIARLT